MCLTLVIYPIVGHWIWGRRLLSSLGFMDFAGDAAVHSVGGWAALAGALLLGPRIGKYDKDGQGPGHPRPQYVPGSDRPVRAVAGLVRLQPGSTMSFQHPADVMHILVTTNTSAIAAVLTSTITSWIVIGKPDLGMTINGCLAGLVGITGSCAYVSIESSLIIGALAGVLVVFAVGFFDKLHVDDPVGATAVHLCCGVFGTLCVGIFSEEGVTTLATRSGLLFGGGFGLLGVQILGVLAVGAFTFVTSGLVWLALKYTVGIRVSPEEEMAGLDIGEHGNIALPRLCPRHPHRRFLRPGCRSRRHARGGPGLCGAGRAGGAQAPRRRCPDQGIGGHRPGPFHPVAERAGTVGRHRPDRDQRLWLRPAEGPRGLLPRRSGGSAAAA